MGRPSKYPDELRERAMPMVAEVWPQYSSQWAAITAVAEDVKQVETRLVTRSV